MKISPEEAMVRLSRLHLAEIGVALTLTVAALLFAAWTVWAAEASGVAVADAWARPAFGHGRATAAYMTIVNKGDEDEVLVAAQSPEATSVELHQTTMKADGVMQMREARSGFPIAADTTLKLAPGGITLLPAWPPQWEADFKLHARKHMVIEGKVRGGKIVDLKVTPASLRNQVTILRPAGEQGAGIDK